MWWSSLMFSVYARIFIWMSLRLCVFTTNGVAVWNISKFHKHQHQVQYYNKILPHPTRMISCHQGQTVHISWNPEVHCCTWDRYCSPTLLLSTFAKSLLANIPKEVFALQESCLDSELPHICEKQQKWPSAWFAGFQFQHCKLQLLNLIERMQTISLSFVTDF